MMRKAKDLGPKTKVKLTREFIRGLVFTGERQEYRDILCSGLLLRVGAKRGIRYAYQYRDANGDRQKYTFQDDPERVDPAEIRQKVRKLGDDPAGEKRALRIEAKHSEARTIRSFVEGRYWTDKLALQSSGLDTQKRILAAWKPFVGIDMAKLDPADFHAHRIDRLEDEIKPQTLNKDRSVLMTMLNQAVIWKLLPRNPLDHEGFRELEGKDEERVRWLGQNDEHEEVLDEYGAKIGERDRFMAAVMDETTPDYIRDMSILALNTGMRRGEIFKLRWESVSIERAQITVQKVTAKNKKTRYITMNDTVKRMLIRRNKVRPIKGGAELVFPNPETGKAFTTVKKGWATLVQRARLVDFHFHDQRHDFASRLVQKGVSLYEVRDLLGHSSIKMTERYAHLAPSQMRSAVKLLDAA